MGQGSSRAGAVRVWVLIGEGGMGWAVWGAREGRQGADGPFLTRGRGTREEEVQGRGCGHGGMALTGEGGWAAAGNRARKGGASGDGQTRWERQRAQRVGMGPGTAKRTAGAGMGGGGNEAALATGAPDGRRDPIRWVGFCVGAQPGCLPFP